MESNAEFRDPFSYLQAPTIWEKLGWSGNNLPLLTLVLVFVAGNLILPGAFEAVSPSRGITLGLAFAAAGALCAELAVLATWLGLGAGSLLVRLAYTLPLVFVVAISYIIGLQVIDDRMPLVICLFILGLAVGGFLSLSLPLLVVRRVAKLVICREGSCSTVDDTTFSIGFLLALTAIAAAIVALLKFIVGDGDSNNGPSSNDIWIMAWLCVHQTVAAILIFLPCFWLGITRRRRWLTFFLSTASLACVPAINVYVMRWYGNAFRDPELFAYTYAFSTGFGLTIIAVSWIVRLVGFGPQRKRLS